MKKLPLDQIVTSGYADVWRAYDLVRAKVIYSFFFQIVTKSSDDILASLQEVFFER